MSNFLCYPVFPWGAQPARSHHHLGVVDYCERYGDNITAICREQCDARQLRGSATAALIEAAQRARVPKAAMGERRQWRDARLASLATHKQAAKVRKIFGEEKIEKKAGL